MARPEKPAEDLVTVGEFFEMIPAEQKADLLSGVIYLASPESIRANDLTGFLTCLMAAYKDVRQVRGKVFIIRVAYCLSRYTALEPDVGYVGPSRVHLIRRTFIRGGPDIAVEVVTRDSGYRDYVLKKRAYQKAGVSEYWIVDPIKDQAQFFRLRNGVYELVALEDGHIFRSEALPGFWLDINWLLADPLPGVCQCLQQILQ
jgi:Uma2 family endonuclease